MSALPASTSATTAAAPDPALVAEAVEALTALDAPRRPPLRRLRSLGAGVLTGVALALAAIVLVPALLGYQRYVITSGSMTGTYDRGSLVFDRVVPTESLRVGDVITYDPPAGGPSGLVTHRIASISRDRQGARTFRTKGDANPTADPWTFTLADAGQARAAFHVPYVGFAFAALGDRRWRMLLIGLPAALVALSVLAGLWREAGETAAARKAAEGPRA